MPRVQGTAMMVLICSRLCQAPRCECCRIHYRDISCTWPHSCAKWGNDLRVYLPRAFWSLEYTWFSRCSWHMKRPNLCDILNLGRVGLRLLIGRWARASIKQTFVGWSTAGSYLPILVLKYDFSSIAEIHDLNHWLAHNRAYGYFGFIDIMGNPALGRRLRRRATRRVK